MSYTREWPSHTRKTHSRGGAVHGGPTRGHGRYGAYPRSLNTTGPTHVSRQHSREDFHSGMGMEDEDRDVNPRFHRRPSVEPEERSFQSTGAYYSLPPKQSKHEELRRSISKEEESVQAHREMKRERNRQKLDSYVPQRLGGPELSPSEKREQIAEKERLVKLEERGKRVLFKEKREEYQRAQREEEDRAIEEKKRVAREQAIRLEEKKRSKESVEAKQVASRLDEMRRVRLQRFGN